MTNLKWNSGYVVLSLEYEMRTYVRDASTCSSSVSSIQQNPPKDAYCTYYVRRAYSTYYERRAMYTTHMSCVYVLTTEHAIRRFGLDNAGFYFYVVLRTALSSATLQ